MELQKFFESINTPEILLWMKKRIEGSQQSNLNYRELTDVNGFDNSNLVNAKQNNYAWSMCDFNGYIYVGTGRNILLQGATLILGEMSLPIDIAPEFDQIDSCAEIWRYKKDGSQPWKCVYKAKNVTMTDSVTGEQKQIPDIIGFRSLVVFKSFHLKPAMYAAAYSYSGVKILKTIDGGNWFEIKTDITDGTSSRCLMAYDNKLYMPVMNDGETGTKQSIIYASDEPELSGWTKVTGDDGEEGKNPIGTVWSMVEYNNRLYVGTAGADGFMIWRTNEREPKVNDWTLVMDQGGGDAKNATALSLTIFNNYLYVGTAYNTNEVISHIIPKGAEIFRIDESDQWTLVVGGTAYEPTTPTTGTRNAPLSELPQGFGNPYNLYMWQMVSYKGKLYVGTFDSAINVEPMLELILKNKTQVEAQYGEKITNLAIKILKFQVAILGKFPMFLGFDLYVSDDGINFRPLNINGFDNRYNYGVRNLFISNDYRLYLGTANPYQGCQVYEINEID